MSLERTNSLSQTIQTIKSNYPVAELILFSVQIGCVCFVTLFCLMALLLEWGPQNLWVMLLSTSIGYIMPSAALKATQLQEQKL